jgi:hypothetical protein
VLRGGGRTNEEETALIEATAKEAKDAKGAKESDQSSMVISGPKDVSNSEEDPE